MFLDILPRPHSPSAALFALHLAVGLVRSHVNLEASGGAERPIANGAGMLAGIRGVILVGVRNKTTA